MYVAPPDWNPTSVQLDILREMSSSTDRHWHITGGQRSGKSLIATYASLFDWGSNFSGMNFALLAKSELTFQAVTFEYVQWFAAEFDLHLTSLRKCWALEDSFGGYNFLYKVLYGGSASGGNAGAGCVGWRIAGG